MLTNTENRVSITHLKLMLLLTAVAIACASILLWDYRRNSYYLDDVARQVEENTTVSNQALAGTTHSIILSTVSVAETLGRNFSHVGFETFSRTVDSILESNESIAAIQIVSLSKSGVAASDFFRLSKNDSAEFNGQNSSQFQDSIIKSGFLLAQTENRDISKNTRLDSSLNKIGVPTILLARKLETPQSDRWIIVSVWSSRFTSSYRQSAKSKNMLINRSGFEFLNFDDYRGSSKSEERVDSTILNTLKFSSEAKTIRKELSDGRVMFERASQLGEFNLFVVSQVQVLVHERSFISQILNMLPSVLVIFLVLLALSHYIAEMIELEMQKKIQMLEKLSTFDEFENIEGHSKGFFSILENKINEVNAKIKNYVDQNEQIVKLKSKTKFSSDIRLMLTPKSIINSNGISSHKYHIHGLSHSGDWWSRFTLGDGSELIVLTDANCNSTQAAIISSLTFAFFANIERMFSQTQIGKKISLSEMVKDLNSALYVAAGGRIHLKLAVLLFDLKDETVSIVNAGNQFIYSYSVGAIESIDSATSLVGIKDEIEVKESILKLCQGHRFVLHTDGLFDCMNGSEEKLSQQEFFELINSNSSHGIELFSRNVFANVDSHFVSHAPADDISILFVEACSSPVGEFRSSWDIDESRVVSFVGKNASLIP